MAPDDREQQNPGSERESDLPVDELKPRNVDASAAEKVKGGLTSANKPSGGARESGGGESSAN
jgi:hypothetical protein